MRITEVVPAPDDPVTDTMGCLRDMAGSAGCDSERTACSIQRPGARAVVVVTVILLDAFDFLTGAEDEWDALVRWLGAMSSMRTRPCWPRRPPALSGTPSVGLVQEPEASRLGGLPEGARLEENPSAT